MSEAAPHLERPEYLDYRVTVMSNPDDEKWREAEALENQVFIANGYVEDSAQLSREYEPYLKYTQMIAIEKFGELAGAVRVIHPGGTFKTLDDIGKGRLKISAVAKSKMEGVDMEQTFEIGTIAVSKAYRRHLNQIASVVMAAYGAINHIAEKNNYKYIIASFDKHYYKNFNAMFATAVHRLGKGKHYMGSVTIPVLIEVPKMIEQLSLMMPEMHNFVRQISLRTQEE